MNIMKKHLFILACLVMAVGGVFAQSATPDMARHELNGGKVKSFDEVSDEGYDMDHAAFNAKGQENFAPQKVKRDKSGRAKSLYYSERYTDGTYISVDTFYYHGAETRLYLHYSNGESIYGGIINSPTRVVHYTYKDNKNHPATTVYIETNAYGQPTVISWYQYNYRKFDKRGNWIERENVYYDYMPEETEGVSKAIEQKILSLAVALTNTHISEAKRTQTEEKLIPLLKKYVKPQKMVTMREIEYYK